ncbi:hypothetical protein [Chromobacterium sp. Panama]|uniref:hypothetical protein n=1 Tax=Chromobacterium sp. Panama TaxID=2161826 RepID=UPI0011B2755E|nr:hypothetical protein [Chromobacterium sp. Panama]
MIKKALFASIAFLASADGFAAESFHSDLGKIQVYAAEIGSHPTPLMKLFNSKISVTDDLNPELAKLLLKEIAAAGYQIAKPEEKSQLYTIEEVYAGKPEDYTPSKESETSGLKFPIFHLIGSGLMCAVLHVCNDPAVAANMAFDSIDNAQAEAIHNATPKLTGGENKASAMVISKLCTMLGKSCALSVALAYDPAVSLDQLRQANAEEGFPRSMLLKK